jgi:PAS domain S-box-containing protein
MTLQDRTNEELIHELQELQQQHDALKVSYEAEIIDRKIHEQRLMQSNRFFNHAQDMLCIAGFDGYFKMLNPSWSKVLGYSTEELLSKPWLEFVHPDDKEPTQNIKTTLVDGQEVYQFENRYVCKDGSIKWLSWNSFPYPTESIMFGVARDITLKKQAEEELKNREKLLNGVFDVLPIGLWFADEQGRLLRGNPAGVKIWGAKPTVSIENYGVFKARRLPSGKPLDADDWALAHTIREGVTVIDELLEIETFDGQTKTILNYTAPVTNDHGKILGAIVVNQDITEKYRAEIALRESKENLSITLQSIGDGVIATDINGLIVRMNPVAEKLCGWTLTEAMGEPLSDVFKIINSDTRQPVANPVRKVLDSGEIVGLANHTVLVSNDGTEHQISDSAAPIKNREGVITGVVLVFSDVTEKYESDVALKESEARYKALHNASFGGIVIHDKGRILECNQGISEITGYAYDELIGMDGLLLIAPDSRDMVLKNILDGYEKPYEAMGIRKDGKLFPLRLEARMVPYKGKNVRTVEFRDITVQKQAERALCDSEAKMRSIYNIAPAGIGVVANRVLMEVNPLVCEMTGYTREELLEKDASMLYPTMEEYDFVGKEKYRQITQSGTGRVESRWRKKDGSIINVLLASTPIDREDFSKGTIFTALDITEHIRAENALLAAKEKAEESDRLKSAFLANMSHEIRTPMNGILGFAELLNGPNLSGDQQKAYIDIIGKSGLRMLNIINNIVDISKIEAGLMKVDLNGTNVNEQIEYIYTFFKPEVETKGMKLLYSTPLPAEEATIITDREKLYAILTNLVKNAIKYSHEGSIEIGYQIADEGVLRFWVKDTGIGIPKDRQEAIFERFIQADIADKMGYQGAGLGLSITRAYIEMLGGTIWVQSEEGVGSTFYFTLPNHAHKIGDITEQRMTISDNTVSGRKLKILIAEDDDVSEMLMEISVQQFGREILKVKTGHDAVQSCQQHPDIDLVLMDIQMPEMNGYEATRQIRKFNQDVVIIAQTAYGQSGDREKALEAGCNNYISKPIKKEELIELIQTYQVNTA